MLAAIERKHMKSRRRYRLFVNAMYSTSSSKNTTKVEDQEKRIDALTAQLKKSRQDKSRRRAHSLERANSPQDESAVADLRRAWSKIPRASLSAFHNQPSRFTAWRLFVSKPCS
jgi:hypothetical protein